MSLWWHFVLQSVPQDLPSHPYTALGSIMDNNIVKHIILTVTVTVFLVILISHVLIIPRARDVEQDGCCNYYFLTKWKVSSQIFQDWKPSFPNSIQALRHHCSQTRQASVEQSLPRIIGGLCCAVWLDKILASRVA